jgi:hypothetical protein
MDFSFGAAKRLYAEHVHPRIYFGPGDVRKLKSLIRTGDGKKIFTAFRARVRPLVEQTLSFETDEALVAAVTSASAPRPALVQATMDMAALSILDDDAEALAAVRRLLFLCPPIERNPPKGQQPRHRLGCSVGRELAIAYDLAQPSLSPAERRAFCSWAYESGVKRTLDALLPDFYKHPGGNIPLTQYLNALTVLLAIDGEPGAPDLADEWARALPMMEASINCVMGPQGYPTEDMGYGTMMVARTFKCAEALRRAGLLDPYASHPRYARFGDAMLHFVQPWGANLSTTGDHGDDFGERVFVLSRLAQETRNDAILWLLLTLPYGKDEVELRKGQHTENSIFSLMAAGRLRRAVHPAKLRHPPATQFCDTGRGIVSFRSGWNRDAAFVIFDGSRRNAGAQGHAHASCGHFSLSAFGEYFGIDTGRYNMEQNCHSVVLIDGKSGRDTKGEWEYVKHDGLLTSFAPGEFVDFASVDSSHQYNCFWARRFLALVKGRGAPPYVWVVDDINKNNDWAVYWWQLHTSPENTIRLRKTHATITGWRHGNKMDVHFVLPSPEEYPRPHRLLRLLQDEAGPSSYKYVGPFYRERVKQFARPADQVHYSTFVRPRLVAKIGGLNGRFMSVLLPRRKDMRPARVRRLKTLPASLAMRVTFDDVEDTVIFAYEHGLLETDDVSARGHWCVVRRSRRSGRVLDCAVGIPNQ